MLLCREAVYRPVSNRRPRRRVAMVLLVCGFALGCAKSNESPRPNILLISIDTLRADHLAAYGYERRTSPQIDRYFADAEVFERAYTPATYTSASVVSMLTGLYPRSHGILDFYRKLSPQVATLPELLRASGYESAGVVSNAVLSDDSLGIAARFDYYDDFVGEKESKRKSYERRASRTTDAALRWLVADRDEARPHLLWVHYIDPHAPYAPPEDFEAIGFEHPGEKPIEGGIGNTYQYLPGVTDELAYIDRYDEEIAYVDQEIGRLLDSYDKAGLLEGAIVILTSDHGETFFEHRPYMEHSLNLFHEVLHIPLIVRWPDAQARRTSAPVSLIDLVPSLLAELEIAVPENVQGVPWKQRSDGDVLLQEVWMGSRLPNTFAPRYSAIYRDQKWNFKIDSEQRVHGIARFDLPEDALEKNPISWKQLEGDVKRPLLGAIKGALFQHPLAPEGEEGERILAPKVAPPLEDHQRDALRALGYLE